MKHLLLAAFLVPATLLAQAARPQLLPPRPQMPGVYQANPQTTEPLPENYQITLTMTDKDGQPFEVSVVVASPQFNVTLGEPNLNFSGTVTVDGAEPKNAEGEPAPRKAPAGDGITVAYALGWQTAVQNGNNNGIMYQSSSTQGSVRLKLGEEVQIFKAGPRVARLSISKLPPAKAK